MNYLPGEQAEPPRYDIAWRVSRSSLGGNKYHLGRGHAIDT